MNKKTPQNLPNNETLIGDFVRSIRKQLGYTQVELSLRIGVGLRFLKELEQGKQSLKLDKVNQVLLYFGPIPMKKENPFEDKTT